VCQQQVIANLGNGRAARRIAVPRQIEDLEAFIPDAAVKAGLNPAKPLAVRLTARATGLRWFVVDGTGNQKPDTRAAFVRRLHKGGLDDASFEAFGIYSPAHKGIATNPSTPVHLHFRTADAVGFVGQLDDDVTLEPEATLFLPAN
jgi:hypothetical protein